MTNSDMSYMTYVTYDQFGYVIYDICHNDQFGPSIYDSDNNLTLHNLHFHA